MRKIQIQNCRECPFCRHNFTCGVPRLDLFLIMPAQYCSIDRIPINCPLPLTVEKDEINYEEEQS